MRSYQYIFKFINENIKNISDKERENEYKKIEIGLDNIIKRAKINIGKDIQRNISQEI